MFDINIEYPSSMLEFSTNRFGYDQITLMLAKRFNKNKFYQIPVCQDGILVSTLYVRKKDILNVSISSQNI